MSATAQTEKFDLFLPELMMSPAELKAAKRCLLALSRQHAKRELIAALPKQSQDKTEALNSLRENLWTELDVLACTVLAREAGVLRYMVLQVNREGGYNVTLQVLNFGLMRDFAFNQWAWKFEGRNVRQDGTLGKNNESTAFNIATISQRKLDGSWLRLKPR
ncbi:hypothetical protein [Polaromonas sp.]|uniref:hypothetical protein n=1 Tax=Polaromonas sp. TaxID=1869339 RepID=UPI002487681B|nr:hypothetical protein [Polaromonas sp.]MDI1339348.1 hypothetical protein [Polaromonas sp.]